MSDIVESLRETFQRRRYSGNAEYDPDFDLFDVAADEIARLRSTIEQLRLVAGAANIERPFHDLKLSVKFGKNHTLGEFNDGKSSS